MKITFSSLIGCISQKNEKLLTFKTMIINFVVFKYSIQFYLWLVLIAYTRKYPVNKPARAYGAYKFQ